MTAAEFARLGAALLGKPGTGYGWQARFAQRSGYTVSQVGRMVRGEAAVSRQAAAALRREAYVAQQRGALERANARLEAFDLPPEPMPERAPEPAVSPD